MSTEVVIRLSHDQVTLCKTFRGTAQNYARETINHAAKKFMSWKINIWKRMYKKLCKGERAFIAWECNKGGQN